MDSKYLAIAVICAISIGMAILTAIRSSGDRPVLLHDFADQAVTERQWSRDVPVEAAFRQADQESIVSPCALQVFDGQLYALDCQIGTVSRLSSSGELLAVYALGGKEEANSLAHKATPPFVSGDTVWIGDQDNYELVAFRMQDGSRLTSHPTPMLPFRIWGSGGNMIVGNWVGDYLFDVMNTHGDSLFSCGRIISNQRTQGFSIQGNFNNRTAGGFVFVPVLADYMFYFSQECELEQVIRLIDRQDIAPTTVRKTASGLQMQAPKSYILRQDVSVVDGIIYVHVRYGPTPNIGRWHSILDKYKSTTGEYIDSIRLPRFAKSAVVDDGSIFMISDERPERIYRFDLNYNGK